MADTTKQRLIDTGLFIEDSDFFGHWLIARDESGAEARLLFNSRGELTSIEVGHNDLEDAAMREMRAIMREADHDNARMAAAKKDPDVAPSP